jgi:putative component of membrane protein insertase Oxa1/YidC/SpoIIIJ protein YidD
VSLLLAVAVAGATPTCDELAAAHVAVPAAPASSAPPPSTIDHAAAFWIALWQGTLSRADGATCALSPSCSTYAREAVRERGPVLGALESAARITRSHAVEGRPVCVGPDGRLRAWDPLSAHPR